MNLGSSVEAITDFRSGFSSVLAIPVAVIGGFIIILELRRRNSRGSSVVVEVEAGAV